ncbi:MAG: carbohydrate ABC transporter permease [Peptococcales bacterium]|jgi:oligogalacturonide transport system permease protein
MSIKIRRNFQERKVEKWTGFIYILPWLLGFSIFQLYPFIATFGYSFTNYTLLNVPSFTGFKNYIRLFTTDFLFQKSMQITGMYTLMAVPGKIVLALIVAMLLSSQIKGIKLYRSLYYLPSILGGSVAVSVLWRVLFMRDGMVNQIIGIVGIPPLDWLTSPNLALLTLSLLQVWQFGSAMVIFLAALKQIPKEIFEAAEVDGASKIRRVFSITIPQISSVIFFNLIMQTIQSLQNFTSAFVITNGGPMRKTYIIGMKLYDDAFKNYNVGYACAESWILFVVILLLTACIFKSSDAWVYYADEGERK